MHRIQTMSLAQKIVALSVAGASVLALSAALAATPAYASDTPYNPNAVITAVADDPSFANDAQYLDVTIDFGADVSGVGAEAMENYLQGNITIAGRTIANGDTDGYYRDVQNVAIDGDIATFDIGPCLNEQGTTEGMMTAIYSGEFMLAASADNFTIASAMGGAPSETLIDTGLAIQKDNAATTSDAAVFTVTDRAQARAMNHILVVDKAADGKMVPIYEGTGSFSNGGMTVHSHTFTSQQVTDYAATIVSTANGMGSQYVFTDLGNGQFSIQNAQGDSSNIQVYMYNCDYLNANHLSVGDITEAEWDPYE